MRAGFEKPALKRYTVNVIENFKGTKHTDQELSCEIEMGTEFLNRSILILSMKKNSQKAISK